MKALVTGSAGFIGYHVSQRLVADGAHVIGIDNLNNFYDVRLKYGRLENAGFETDRIAYWHMVHSQDSNQSFVQLDLTDIESFVHWYRAYYHDAIEHIG